MSGSGDNPVPEGGWVRVTFRNGTVETLPSQAVDWGKRGEPEDVVAWERAPCPNRTVSDSRTAHLEE